MKMEDLSVDATRTVQVYLVAQENDALNKLITTSLLNWSSLFQSEQKKVTTLRYFSHRISLEK